ncbi:DUF4197 domain-containing protein [Flavobacteriaceae bacterium F08102]|nr:DUF4197 domain-containing protein [Flavobacteriaceae bacterium F08102]
MKNIKFIPLVLLFITGACAELQQMANQLPASTVSNLDIASGLKQALQLGIDKQVSKLTAEDGFFKNELVKIALPDELKKVDQALRGIGLGNLADEGLKVLNRAAEDAVAEATPIFVNAVRNMTFDDAKNILLGADNAATTYLESTTSKTLYEKFNPVIKESFANVGADQIWSNLISKYNTIPFVSKVNPDLTDYVTNEALKGVYTMISVEEKEIRTNLSARSNALLQKVFALQD